MPLKKQRISRWMLPDEIVKMVGVINDTTQLIAARAEELAANSENMRNEAELLNSSISYFKSTVNDDSAN